MRIGIKEVRHKKGKPVFRGYIDKPFRYLDGALTIKQVCDFRQNHLPEIFGCNNNCQKKLVRRKSLKRTKITHNA